MFVAILLFLVGLVILVFGAELVVRGASKVAAFLKVTPMVIGLTIVSMGTSAPELAVGTIAGLQGNGGLAVGNIAGTNVLNLLFIMGLSAAIHPLLLHGQVFQLELPAIVFSAGLMTTLAWDGVLSFWDGLLMLLFGVAYTVALILVTRRASRASQADFNEEYSVDEVPKIARKRQGIWYLSVLVVGIILTVAGAEVLVRGAVELATIFGVSTTTIGLTIVAMGTSAPELVTTVLSTIKGDRDVAVGNLIGSSIYNILIILSIPCMLAPGGLPVERSLLWFDIPLMAAVAIGAVPIFVTGRRISRWEGALGVAIYLAYLYWLINVRK